MAVTVDYRCGTCGATAEARVPSPPPPERACGDCGAAARRVWSAVGVVGRARQPASGPPSAGGPDCLVNRDIPGLCTLSPTAARSLVARVRGDNRALDRELAYQERMQRDAPGLLTVGGHAHPTPAAAAPAPAGRSDQ